MRHIPRSVDEALTRASCYWPPGWTAEVDCGPEARLVGHGLVTSWLPVEACTELDVRRVHFGIEVRYRTGSGQWYRGQDAQHVGFMRLGIVLGQAVRAIPLWVAGARTHAGPCHVLSLTAADPVD